MVHAFNVYDTISVQTLLGRSMTWLGYCPFTRGDVSMFRCCSPCHVTVSLEPSYVLTSYPLQLRSRSEEWNFVIKIHEMRRLLRIRRLLITLRKRRREFVWESNTFSRDIKLGLQKVWDLQRSKLFYFGYHP